MLKYVCGSLFSPKEIAVSDLRVVIVLDSKRQINSEDGSKVKLQIASNGTHVCLHPSLKSM